MNKHSQHGMTTIGWILVIGIFAMIAITGIKILPLYLEYYQVRSIMEYVAEDKSIDARSKKDMWSAINKRLLINQIRGLSRENFSFTRENDKTRIVADYEVRRPYIAQLFIGAHFTYSVEFTR